MDRTRRLRRDMAGDAAGERKLLGGRINYFLDYEVYDVPGQFGKTGRQLRDAFIVQVSKSPAKIRMNELVKEVQQVKGGFLVTTSKDQFIAKTVISAVGNGYLHPKKFERIQISKPIYRLEYQFVTK